MKLLTAVSAAALVASTLVIGATQFRQAAAAASGPPPYFLCATGALCVEPLQFQSTLPEIDDNDQAQTRTSTVYNNTAGPVTITGYKFLNDTLPYPTFGVDGAQTCVGRTLQPGAECGFNVTVFLAGRPQYRDPEIATFEVDATAGGGAGSAITGTAAVQVFEKIRPDNDLTTAQPWREFSADHVGATTPPQTISLSGYGAVEPPPVHIHAALDRPPIVLASGSPSGYDHLWYRVIGATVVDDRPPALPSEYQVDVGNCYGKSINTEASAIEAGSASCNSPSRRRRRATGSTRRSWTSRTAPLSVTSRTAAPVRRPGMYSST